MVAGPEMTRRPPEDLARVFRHFGEVETPRMGSRVYTDFSFGVAEDPELLALASQIDFAQPAPNVLFAAVQDLLFENADASPEAEALAVFYPAISGGEIPDHPAFPAFRDFCLAHADRLGPKLRTGRTQTCVVLRCAIVLPSLAVIPRVEAAGGKVALLEIGPSAGLNLRIDRYRYAYRRAPGAEDGSATDEIVRWGDPAARPKLCSVIRGAAAPPVPGKIEIVARHGLDLNPIDLDDEAAIRWQRALIWPEHAHRAAVMSEAIERARSVPVQIEQGDATTDIADQIEKLPADAARVVFATHVFYQIPPEGRTRVREGLAEASRDAPVDLVLMESSGEGDSRLEWFHFESGEQKQRTTLARADSHGRWIEWGAA